MAEKRIKHPVTLIIEWHEHDMLNEIDKFVEEEFSNGAFHSYINNAYDSVHMMDYKYAATKWAKDGIELYEKLIEMIDKLPEDEVLEYEVPA